MKKNPLKKKASKEAPQKKNSKKSLLKKKAPQKNLGDPEVPGIRLKRKPWHIFIKKQQGSSKNKQIGKAGACGGSQVIITSFGAGVAMERKLEARAPFAHPRWVNQLTEGPR